MTMSISLAPAFTEASISATRVAIGARPLGNPADTAATISVNGAAVPAIIRHGSIVGYQFHPEKSQQVGLQILKNSQKLADHNPLDLDLPDGEKIRRARAILSMDYANPPTLPALAQQLGISETRLKSGFKSMHGTTVMQYCINKRIEAAMLLLKENRHTISEIGDIVGYEDHSAFSRAFRRHSGYSPKEWRMYRSG